MKKIREQRLSGESLDDYIERVIREEREYNKEQEIRDEVKRGVNLAMQEFYWKKWVKMSGRPLGKKLGKRRANFFRKYLATKSGEFHSWVTIQ